METMKAQREYNDRKQYNSSNQLSKITNDHTTIVIINKYVNNNNSLGTKVKMRSIDGTVLVVVRRTFLHINNSLIR